MTEFCLIREASEGRGYLLVKGHIVRCWWCDAGEPHPSGADDVNRRIIQNAERFALTEFDGVGIA